MFRGHPDFKASFGPVRYEDVTAESFSDDPLYYMRTIFNHFTKNSFSVAVPRGVLAIDENGQPTSAKTRAKSYNPNKPDPHAIRFYTVNGHSLNYVLSLMDNGSGNSTKGPVVVVDRYLVNFPECQKMVNKFHATKQKPEHNDVAYDRSSKILLFLWI